MKSNFEISENLLIILRNYRDFSHEVGGMIFGENILEKTVLNSVSIKHGRSLSIEFNIEDTQLFSPPENLVIIGSWHLHPAYNAEIPSMTDQKQWLVWGPEYLHIILSKTGCTLYQFNSKRVAQYYFESEV